MTVVALTLGLSHPSEPNALFGAFFVSCFGGVVAEVFGFGTITKVGEAYQWKMESGE